MKTKFHFLTYLLITLISINLYSQGSGWVKVYTIQWPDVMYEVQFVDIITGFVGGGEGKLYKTTNAGENWILIEHNVNSTFNSIFFLDANTGFMGGDFGRLFRTTDGGISLDTIYPGMIDHFHSVYFPSRDTGYIASKYGGILKTINCGSNWVILRPRLQGYSGFEGLHCLDNSLIFASGFSGSPPNFFQIFRSTNGGESWNSIYIPSVGSVYGVHFTDHNTGFIASPSGKIFKTTNIGLNWTLKLADSLSGFWSLFFVNFSTGFAVGNSGYKLAKTTDAGETWSLYQDYLFNDLYSVYFVDENTGVAVGYSGIIRTTNGGVPIGIRPISKEIPASFSLFQNYPNPFNPNSKIKFQIPKFSHVKLTVFDMLGKEIHTLVNEKLSPGTYEADFDGSNLSSGIYLYTLEAGDYVESRKTVLMR